MPGNHLLWPLHRWKIYSVNLALNLAGDIAGKFACTPPQKLYSEKPILLIRGNIGKSSKLSLPENRLVGVSFGSNNKPEGVIMRLYESVFIARQDITTAQVETMADEFAAIITSAGGSIKKREYWGLRSLAYRIKKNRKGHYSLLNINCPAAALTEMERNMRLHEDVLRYMSVRVDEHEEEPSVMMQSKSSRDDRDRDRDRGRDRPKTETAAPAAAAATAASEATAAAPEAVEAHAAAAAEAPAASEESAPAADDKDTKE